MSKNKFQAEQLTINSKKELKALHTLIGGLTGVNEVQLGLKSGALDELYFELKELMEKYKLQPVSVCVDIK
jgi:hypothetical protein